MRIPVKPKYIGMKNHIANSEIILLISVIFGEEKAPRTTPEISAPKIMFILKDAAMAVRRKQPVNTQDSIDSDLPQTLWAKYMRALGRIIIEKTKNPKV